MATGFEDIGDGGGATLLTLHDAGDAGEAGPAAALLPPRHDGDNREGNGRNGGVGTVGRATRPGVLAACAFVAVALVAVSGGVAYAIGLMAADIKAVAGYSQEGINAVSAALYVGVSAFVVPISFAQERAPGAVMSISGLVVAGGWALAFVAVARKWNAYLFAALMGAIGLAIGSLPMPTIITAFGDVIPFNPALAPWILTMFVSLYGGAGGVAGATYLIRFDSLASKLEVFMLAYAGLALASGLFVIMWLRLPRMPPPQPPAPEQPAAAVVAPADGDWLQPQEPRWRRALRSLRPIVTSPDAWMLQLLFALLFGCAVNFYNTSGSIALSLGGSDDEGRYLFILFSVGQTAARLTVTPYIGTKANRSHVNHVLVLDVIILAAVGALAATVNSPGLMYGLAVVNGVAYGSLWVILFAFRDVELVLDPAAAAADGTSGYVLYGVMNIGPAVGPAIFDKLSGMFYDRLADSAHLCNGMACYANYFWLHVGATGAAALLIALLACRTPGRCSCGARMGGGRHGGDFAQLADGVNN